MSKTFSQYAGHITKFHYANKINKHVPPVTIGFRSSSLVVCFGYVALN